MMRVVLDPMFVTGQGRGMHQTKGRGWTWHQTEFAQVGLAGCGQRQFDDAGLFGAFNDIPFEHRCGGFHKGEEQGEQGEKNGGNHTPNFGASTHECEHLSGGMLTARGAQVRSMMDACWMANSVRKKNPAPTFRSGTNLTKLSLDA